MSIAVSLLGGGDVRKAALVPIRPHRHRKRVVDSQSRAPVLFGKIRILGKHRKQGRVWRRYLTLVEGNAVKQSDDAL
jgi:hypothetical protein